MVWKWDIFSNIHRDLVILFGDIEVSFGADLTLIDLVKKTIIPYSAVQNFGDSITKKYPPIIKMSNSYVKMFVVGGLCLKSVFTYDQFLYVVQMFKMSQQITGHTVMFQEEACNQAVELLQSYDRRLDRLFANRLISLLYTQSENLVFPPFPVHYELVIQSVNAAFGE